MSKLFIPRELKTIEVDTEKRIFRVNGEDFGQGCTGFRIKCHRYDEFDIRMEVDTTVHLVTIRGGKCIKHETHETSDPWYSTPEAVRQEVLYEQAEQIEDSTQF